MGKNKKTTKITNSQATKILNEQFTQFVVLYNQRIEYYNNEVKKSL